MGAGLSRWYGGGGKDFEDARFCGTFIFKAKNAATS